MINKHLGKTIMQVSLAIKHHLYNMLYTCTIPVVAYDSARDIQHELLVAKH